ncbi:MAG: bifunctional phosphoribosylaminoimidazolecarboxamide formyltransferase/IMP cyclohydrolase [Candidatus Dormibacteraeota bacterium]|nr:bifunctional phosphoribosylaminoimidazolecarboxamide formyltransferase/IMP cyclohydrolase [Candidatus Dormibacteraeota bacterium]
MPRALLSVSNKAGLPAFARGLARLGYELFSTGNTLRALEVASIDAQPVARLTGFPEILDGRVKTLHPGVHAGLLARRDLPAHLRALQEHGLKTIDLLCVNLYPFAATEASPDATPEEVLEQIDVGGPAMIRAAAKNHEGVVVVVRPERYSEILAALGGDGLGPGARRRLAAEAFAHTAAYDAHISEWLRAQEPEAATTAWPPDLAIAGTLNKVLRYGENPHQRAAFYRADNDSGGLGSAAQLHGGELGYNNIQDASAALELVAEFDRPAAAIVKHMNPCGLAVADSVADAYRAAFDCDRTSAYGGVLALNRELDEATAEAMAGLLLEVAVAPSVSPAALARLRSRSKLRLLTAAAARSGGESVRGVPGGFLIQDRDRVGFDRAACTVAGRRQPSESEWEQLGFAWLAVKHVRSNAIVIANGLAAVGVGAGQMSRVEAVEMAVRRAGDRARGGVLASDAFFPFADGVEAALAAGVTAIIQPGGSVRDAEAVSAVDRAGAAMVFTGERHFRH